MAGESIRRAKLHKGNDESGFTTEALSKLIAGALPSRELAVNRDALVRSIRNVCKLGGYRFSELRSLQTEFKLGLTPSRETAEINK